MIITIDCRMLNSSGVGAYLQGILPYLINSKYDILLFGNKKNINSLFPNLNAEIIECNIKPFSIKELFFFDKKIKDTINKTDIYLSPYFNIPNGINIPVYTTIHDIIFPDIKITSTLGLFLRMFFYRRAYKLSKKIFTVSNFSKSRIEFHLGDKTPVIVVNGSAVDNKVIEYRKKNNKITKKQTIVFVGNIKKHKGLSILLEAFIQAKLDGLPHDLVVIGNIEKFRTSDSSIIKKINSLNNNSIILTGLVSDEKLIEILSNSSLLIHPSLYEGFGLPPLEALTLGTAVLISDIPVFKEVYANFPVTFFKTGDSNDLKMKLMSMLYNKTPPVPVLSDELLNKYTFEKTTSKILEELL